MVETARKLIAEYEKKVVVCETHLADIKQKNTFARSVGDVEGMADFRAERMEWSARRQAYMQAISDFKSIIGEI